MTNLAQLKSLARSLQTERIEDRNDDEWVTVICLINCS